MVSLLEALPPELRRYLLSTLEIEELNLLVHASPTYHQQYLLDRRFLLCSSLENTLGNTTVDACAAYRTGTPDFARTRSNAGVTCFVAAYRDRLARPTGQGSVAAERFALDEIVSVVVFFRHIVRPLARAYVERALAAIATRAGRDTPDGEPLSRSEEARLVRGMYRFQLRCNLFGRGEHGVSARPGLDLRAVELLDDFIGLFEPWQVEETTCVYLFAKQTYDRVFGEIRCDVHESNPRFRCVGCTTTLEGTFELDNSWTRESLLSGTVSRGLVLLHTILFRVRDHADLVATMQARIAWPAGAFLGEESLSETAQFRRRGRLRPPSTRRDVKQTRRDPLPFAGDADAEGPPLAWTLLWRGTYSNLHGYYVRDEIRSLGYVVWDAGRIARTGAADVIMRLWAQDWSEVDPRDLLFY